MARELGHALHRYGFKSGFLKLAVLKLVSKGPIHGYALMKEIQRLTDEDWRPSPGSIYPALRELVSEGMVQVRVQGRRKVYEITPKGADDLVVAMEHAEETMRHINRLLTI